MKPAFIKLPNERKETFTVKHSDLPCYQESMHYHDGYQLTYVFQNGGFLYLGEKFQKIHKGELYLIGKNIPHLFLLNEKGGEENLQYTCKTTSVFFSMDKLHGLLDDISEAAQIKAFLENSNSGGIQIFDDSEFLLEQHFRNIIELKGFERVIELLNIFLFIVRNYKSRILRATVKIDNNTNDNLKKVCDYVLANFNEKIAITDVASMAYMTPTSFSRFFKQKTNQPFSVFLTRVRINNASLLLAKNNISVTEACYASGFNNLSNFHRHFHHEIGMTPNQYRKAVCYD